MPTREFASFIFTVDAWRERLNTQPSFKVAWVSQSLRGN